jgi:hypothetical protein
VGIDTSFDASVVLHPSSCHLFSLPHCASHKLLPDPRTAIQSSAILSRALSGLGETWELCSTICRRVGDHEPQEEDE